MIRILLTHILLLTTFFTKAQDIHWSQFNDNPIFQNPAQSGFFDGDYRFIGNYRDQWRSVTVPFSTFSMSADTRFEKIGTGILFFHDVAGDGKFRTIELNGNIAYPFFLTKDSLHQLRLGANFGMNHRQFNFDQFYFDNQYNGMNYDPTLPTGENIGNEKKTNFTIGLGGIYRYFIHKRMNFTGGIGIFNLNRPDQGFYGSNIPRHIRTNIFLRSFYQFGYDWDLLPSISLSFQQKYRELVIGSSVKYTLVERLGEYRAFYGGLWWRNKDAMFLTLGMDYQDWFFGISYDINLSKLIPASHARGGIEFAIRYILHRFKPSKNYFRICPDYI